MSKPLLGRTQVAILGGGVVDGACDLTRRGLADAGGACRFVFLRTGNGSKDGR